MKKKKRVMFKFDERSEQTFEDYCKETGKTIADFVEVQIVKDGKPSTVLIPKL